MQMQLMQKNSSSDDHATKSNYTQKPGQSKSIITPRHADNNLDLRSMGH